MKIAICDDNSTMLDYVGKVIAEHFDDYSDGFSLHSYTDGERLLSDNKAERFDVLFLDIQMPNIDGFEIARAIRQQSKDTYVIFITSNDSLMSDAFDYQPFHFICKRDRSSIERDIRRVLSKLVEHIKRYSASYTVVSVSENRSVAVNEILFVEADGHYLKYHINGKDTLRVRRDMQVAEEAMAAYDFIRIHRSYLINPLQIKRLSMKNDMVTLLNGKELPIGRNFKKDTAERYGSFCSNNNI